MVPIPESGRSRNRSSTSQNRKEPRANKPEEIGFGLKRSGNRDEMMSEESVEKWLGAKEVQEYLGVGRETISEWIAKRGMPA